MSVRGIAAPPARPARRPSWFSRYWLPALIAIAVFVALVWLLMKFFNARIWRCIDCREYVSLATKHCGNCGMETPVMFGCIVVPALIIAVFVSVMILVRGCTNEFRGYEGFHPSGRPDRPVEGERGGGDDALPSSDGDEE